jgi:hypothetical protein
MGQPLNRELALFHDLCTHLPLWMPMGHQHRSGKGRRSLPGNDWWQKGATGPYLRQFDAYHRLKLAMHRDFEQEFDSFWHRVKKASL